MGKTSGRGMKGNTARSGGAVALGFEGGQTPLWRRTPKIGYMHRMFLRPLEIVNLDKLQLWIDQGRVDASQRITMRTLLEAGLVSGIEYGVKLLGGGAGGSFVAKVDIEVTQASEAAIAAVEAAGGSIVSGAWQQSARGICAGRLLQAIRCGGGSHRPYPQSQLPLFIAPSSS